MAAATSVILRAERWLDEVVIQATSVDAGGADFSETINHGPLNVGDLAIMEVMLTWTTIATLVTTAELGALAKILSPAGSANLDILGVSRYVKIQDDALAAYWSPDPLVLWRAGELLTFEGAEVDSNVAPTADATYLVKCVRVRPIEASAQPQPIRLVR